uniref:Ovule protein n=1 Tax=Loa loa TaxID=7209 RepID=A0A1I7V5Z5_LOALO
MGSDTVSHQDYVNRTGERYPVTKPQDSDLLHGDGSFISETQTATEFTAKKGERYDAKRPVESELWKYGNVGVDCNKSIGLVSERRQMGSDTVSHQDYVNRTGERYPVTKPQDSDLLHGDGSFMSETQTATEFTAKKGERYDAKRPVESELWKLDSFYQEFAVQQVKQYSQVEQYSTISDDSGILCGQVVTASEMQISSDFEGAF